MKDSIFTPGPWEVGFRLGSECRFIYAPTKEKVRSGAEVEVHTLIVEDCDRALDEADARLISASPDLIRILKALVDYDEGSMAEGTFGLEIWEEARAIIAKAEGRA